MDENLLFPYRILRTRRVLILDSTGKVSTNRTIDVSIVAKDFDALSTAYAQKDGACQVDQYLQLFYLVMQNFRT